MSERKITASVTFTGREPISAVAVNPGDWFGRGPWLIGHNVGCSAAYYVVEADNCSDALDIFAESDHGACVRIDIDVEGGDYGYSLSSIGMDRDDLGIARSGYQNLKGEIVSDYVSEPSVAGNGTYYDSDNLSIDQSGDNGIRILYHVEYDSCTIDVAPTELSTLIEKLDARDEMIGHEPGSIVDSLAYEWSMDGCNETTSRENWGDNATLIDLTTPYEHGVYLTADERAFLASQKAVIVRVDSDGNQDFDWYESLDDASAEFASLQDDYEGPADDDDDDTTD